MKRSQVYFFLLLWDVKKCLCRNNKKNRGKIKKFPWENKKVITGNFAIRIMMFLGKVKDYKITDMLCFLVLYIGKYG